jgi:Fur family ferric uptake transcriptional regulator
MGGMQRETQQRRAIRRALETSERPLSPHEVLAASRRRVPRLGLATVYRALKSLHAEGWLAAIELPGEPARYEPAGKRHHHHFRCRRCEKVFEFPGCATPSSRTPRGFVVESHETLYHGRCAGCVGAA